MTIAATNPIGLSDQEISYDFTFSFGDDAQTSGYNSTRPVLIAGREAPEWINDLVSRIDALRALGPNWDSYGASPVNMTTIAHAREIARKLAGFVGVTRPVLSTGPNGEVGFSWDTGKWSLDASVDDEGMITYVYLEEAGREVESRTRDPHDLLLFLTHWT